MKRPLAVTVLLLSLMGLAEARELRLDEGRAEAWRNFIQNRGFVCGSTTRAKVAATGAIELVCRNGENERGVVRPVIRTFETYYRVVEGGLGQLMVMRLERGRVVEAAPR